MQETLHKHNVSDESNDDVEALENEITEKEAQKDENPLLLLLNWPLMSSIIVYCVFSLHDIAYQEVNFLLSNDRNAWFYASHIEFVLFELSSPIYFNISLELVELETDISAIRACLW